MKIDEIACNQSLCVKHRLREINEQATKEGEYPEPTPNEFQGGEDFDDEYARMAQHVEELQGMTEIDGEDL